MKYSNKNRVGSTSFKIVLFLIALILLILSFEGKTQDKRTANFPKKVEFPEKLPSPENFWLFVMAGQSNMAGRGFVEPADTVPDPRILAIDLNTEWVFAKEPLHQYQPKLTGLDCGMSFAKELLKNIGDSITIGLIPCAVGGSSVENWLNDSLYNGVHLFSNFKEKVGFAMKYGQLQAILWHQGESDAFPEKLPVYKTKIEKLFDGFRGFVGNDSLPIIMGELGSYYYPEERQARWDSINSIIRDVAKDDAYCFPVPTNDLTSNEDRVHFNSASQRTLGKRYAEKFYFRKNKKLY